MRARIFRVVPLVVMPVGHYTSIPSQIGTSCPIDHAIAARAKEHPQTMSFTVASSFQPLEPENDSILGIESPLASPTAPAA
jgi:hypothetical protein